jgi:site-specific DNA-methyltransferase (cytosine-N4-specific)
MAITSPPYYALRSYLPQDHPLKDNEVGTEYTPAEYVASLVGVFSLVRDVLNDDGTLWLNIGDCYATHNAKGPNGGQFGKEIKTGFDDVFRKDVKKGAREAGLKEKDLIGIPWMLAFALRDDGWYLRSDVIWCKGASGQKEMVNQVYQSCLEEGLDAEAAQRIIDRLDPYVGSCMPESVKDRVTRSHEYFFMLSKSQRYYFDRDAIAEDSIYGKHHEKYQGTYTRHKIKSMQEHGAPNGENYQVGLTREAKNPMTRNRRSVWNITTRSYKGAHFAVFPPELIEPPILACSKPGDLVLDPFMGSGTVAGVCEKLDRAWIGCELNESFAELLPKRIEEIKNGK